MSTAGRQPHHWRTEHPFANVATMCGRVAQSRKLAELERRFGAGAGELTVKEWKPSYNLAPTREILAVHEGVTCELKPPYPLTHHPVDRRVGNSKNDWPELTEAVK